jgi:hypothetical protein
MVYGFKDDPDESICEVSDDDSDGDVSEYYFILRGISTLTQFSLTVQSSVQHRNRTKLLQQRKRLQRRLPRKKWHQRMALTTKMRYL